MQLRVLIALLSFRAKNSDTIWPKRSQISERCGYNERVITRVTTQLVKLGWLEKAGKGGFSKSCEYRITVPDLVTVDEDETVTSPDTEDYNNGDQIGNGNQSGNGNQTSANNGNHSGASTVTSSVTGNKQTNNIPVSDHSNNADSESDVPRDAKYLGDLDFTKWPELPSEQVWKDFKKHRQAKKSPITQTVINKMATQLQLAADAGYSVDDCLAEQLDAGWSGFKFDWFQNRRNSNAANQSGSGKRNRDDEIERAAAEYLASTSGEAGVHGSELEGTYAVETGSPDAGLPRIPHMGQKLQ